MWPPGPCQLPPPLTPHPPAPRYARGPILTHARTYTHLPRASLALPLLPPYSSLACTTTTALPATHNRDLDHDHHDCGRAQVLSELVTDEAVAALVRGGARQLRSAVVCACPGTSAAGCGRLKWEALARDCQLYWSATLT